MNLLGSVLFYIILKTSQAGVRIVSHRINFNYPCNNDKGMTGLCTSQSACYSESGLVIAKCRRRNEIGVCCKIIKIPVAFMSTISTEMPPHDIGKDLQTLKMTLPITQAVSLSSESTEDSSNTVSRQFQFENDNQTNKMENNDQKLQHNSNIGTVYNINMTFPLEDFLIVNSSLLPNISKLLRNNETFMNNSNIIFHFNNNNVTYNNRTLTNIISQIKTKYNHSQPQKYSDEYGDSKIIRSSLESSAVMKNISFNNPFIWRPVSVLNPTTYYTSYQNQHSFKLDSYTTVSPNTAQLLEILTKKSDQPVDIHRLLPSTRELQKIVQVIDSGKTSKSSVDNFNLSAICGKTSMRTPKILGGENAIFGEFPWQVSLQRNNGITSKHKCGAVILHPKWVATAAHCAQEIPLEEMAVRYGDIDIETSNSSTFSRDAAVENAYYHPFFDPIHLRNDLALLKMKFSLPMTFNTLPICLPPSQNYSGMMATLTGWGLNSTGGYRNNVLQKVEVPVLTNAQCEQKWHTSKPWARIEDEVFCTGLDEGGKDSCQGDSGGAAQVKVIDNWVLLGIISWGGVCGDKNQPSAQVNIIKFIPWISDVTQNEVYVPPFLQRNYGNPQVILNVNRNI